MLCFSLCSPVRIFGHRVHAPYRCCASTNDETQGQPEAVEIANNETRAYLRALINHHKTNPPDEEWDHLDDAFGDSDILFEPRYEAGEELPKAPNAMKGEPEDFLQELVALMAKEEQQKRRVLTEEEMETKRLLELACDLFASTHSDTERLDNLRPWKLKKEKEKVCEECNGTGMVKCKTCDGEGFVDLGENGERFVGKGDGWEVTMPKKVMGSTYHCPMCGGLTEERCENCLGFGVVKVDEERSMFEARMPWGDIFGDEENSVEAMLEKEIDRVEISKEGVVVLKAEKRRRPGRPRKKKPIEYDENGNPKAEQKTKRKRGRPRKIVKEEDNK